MPFENLKRQLDLQKQAKDAELKHQQWLEEKQRSLAESQLQGRERQEQEIINQLRECYSSSHVDEFANELMNIVPGMKKTLNERPNVNKEKVKKNKGMLRKLFGPKEIDNQKLEIYFCIKLTWNMQTKGDVYSSTSLWNYIDIGFLEDKTLVVDGCESKGGFTSIPEQQWRGNPKLIENAIENGYLYPQFDSSTYSQYARRPLADSPNDFP